MLKHEGGWADHPKDPGGATMKGVTLATYRRHFGKNKSKRALRNISDDDLGQIYRSGYWDKCRCDRLPSGVDYAVFDAAVNSGPGRSVKEYRSQIRLRYYSSLVMRSVPVRSYPGLSRPVSEFLCRPDQMTGVPARCQLGPVCALRRVLQR